MKPRDRRSVSHLTLTERAAAVWARRQLKSIDHERRVLLIASKLFDLTAPLHELSSRERKLLRLSALLHDVGRRFGEKNHPADGARMIEDEGYLPLSSSQRRCLMYLTRFHRGAVPEIGFDGILKRRDNRKAMRTVLALLRAADALDNRQLDPPAIAIARKGSRIEIACYVESNVDRARKAFKRYKKFQLLEETLDCRIGIEVKRVEHVTHV